VEYLPPPPEPVNAAASVPAPIRQRLRSGYLGVTANHATCGGRVSGLTIGRAGCGSPLTTWWTPVGYVFVEGYWDLEMGRRGLVFRSGLFPAAPMDRGVLVLSAQLPGL